MSGNNGNRMNGRTVLIPRMSDEGAVTFAAAFRSVGIKAEAVAPSNARSLELGARHTSGDECYPEKVTLGDFLRAIDEVGADKVAFFMPTADGPCRFGQYAPYLRKVLRDMGHESIPVVSPTSSNGYDGLTEHAGELVRTAWRALVSADAVRKLRLRFRPYEQHKGDTDSAAEASLDDLCRVLERQNLDQKARMKELVAAMERTRDRFQSVTMRQEVRPLVGVVGEIFCRLSNFSNEDVIRKIEDHGGECWLSDVTEWVWYTNQQHEERLVNEGRKFSGAMLKAKIKGAVQRRDEHKLLHPIHHLLVGREEPHGVEDVLERSRPYLPHTGALGEMVLSVGKAIYLHEKGAAGIADISPFTCMNGIVCEAIYPRVSADQGGIPIRVFYFDGTQKSIEQEVGIFLQLVKNYQRKQLDAKGLKGVLKTTAPQWGVDQRT
ncbi:MAG: hypothetical protein HYX75_18135 [Acidobacteria bacterium]|nr:hypothetical protein [Acidobacteriota bacterium]